MAFPDTYGSGEQKEKKDLSFWVQGKERQGPEEKPKWFRLRVGEQTVYNGLKTKADGRSCIKKGDTEMPQHWLRYVMQPWDKDLKKWHFVAVLLRSWLSDYPESWYYLLSQLLWEKNPKFSAGTTAIPLRQAGAARRRRAARQGAGPGQGQAVGAEAAITPSTAPWPHRRSGAGPGRWTRVRQTPLPWYPSPRPGRDVTAASRRGARPGALVRAGAKTQPCSWGDGPCCQTLGVPGFGSQCGPGMLTQAIPVKGSVVYQ